MSDDAVGDPTGMDLVGVADAIRMRKISSVEVTTACIRRIERLQSRLNCFIAFDPEDALTQAKRADREASEGVFRGPLHGVPLAHKDMLDRKSTRLNSSH